MIYGALVLFCQSILPSSPSLNQLEGTQSRCLPTPIGCIPGISATFQNIDLITEPEFDPYRGRMDVNNIMHIFQGPVGEKVKFKRPGSDNKVYRSKS